VKRAALALLLAVAACAPRPETPTLPPSLPSEPRLTLSPARFEELQGWSDDRQDEALPAFLRSCEKMSKLPPDAPLGDGKSAGRAGDWQPLCREAQTLPKGNPQAARTFFEKSFLPWRVEDGGKSGDKAQGLFTGYYEAELTGSRERNPKRKQVPIFGPPADLITVNLGEFRDEWRGQQIAGRIEGGHFRPYDPRERIEAGSLSGKAPVLAWADDAVDLHILHIQGSGRMKLAEGGELRLGFAASNGHKFLGLGRILKDAGKIRDGEDGSMQAVRSWLKANPGEAAPLMAKNPRFIFLRRIEGDGPVGAQGVALVPGRSMAVDNRFIALGAPLWLETREPAGKPLRRLMVAQDVGAAIKGVVRGDVFFGSGEAALDLAGRMKSPGVYYALLPKSLSPALAFSSAPAHPQTR
jgi:membrane-bound lytic murein transglycosylase A